MRRRHALQPKSDEYERVERRRRLLHDETDYELRATRHEARAKSARERRVQVEVAVAAHL